MIKHLFKLIWNKKKQNFLLITEMFVSFMVVFAVFTLLVYNYKNYKIPMGLAYDNVWVVNYAPPVSITSNDSASMFVEVLRKKILSMDKVKEMSYTSPNIPFSMNTSNSSIGYGKQSVMSNFYDVEDSYATVLNVNMLAGRWFTKEDDASTFTPVIINQKLKEKLFGDEDPIGKVLGEDASNPGNLQKGNGNRWRVIGLVDNIKMDGDYQDVEAGLYKRMDTNSLRSAGTILLTVQPGTGAAFESKLYKTLASTINTTAEIEHLDKKLVNKNKMMLVPTIIMLVIAGFLIINVALGLFGVLWYNINKRRGEIGLRRAVGASGAAVSKQLVVEALLLATLSLVIGSFFAIQFPLMNVFDLDAGTYLIAHGLSVAFLYILVIICALYPGRQAASIYPAIALHEE